jgi:hypothetical protein
MSYYPYVPVKLKRNETKRKHMNWTSTPRPRLETIPTPPPSPSPSPPCAALLPYHPRPLCHPRPPFHTRPPRYSKPAPLSPGRPPLAFLETWGLPRRSPLPGSSSLSLPRVLGASPPLPLHSWERKVLFCCHTVEFGTQPFLGFLFSILGLATERGSESLCP